VYGACANFAGSIAHSASKRLLRGAWQATDLPNVGMALSLYRLFWYKVVGGWGLDGITIFQKGLPLAFNNAIPNYTASFGGGSRPNVLAGCNKSAPADFTYGNKSRTDPRLRSSGVNNWDFALFRRPCLARMTGCELLFAPNSSTSSSATSGASQHFCWQLNLRPGIQYLPRHEPAPLPVRTEIHVLALQAHGLAVQAYPELRF